MISYMLPSTSEPSQSSMRSWIALLCLTVLAARPAARTAPARFQFLLDDTDAAPALNILHAMLICVRANEQDMENRYDTWMEAFMQAWKDRDVDAVMETIASDCAYYESVFEQPREDNEAIRALWEVVPENQEDIDYDYELICSDDEHAVFNWKLTRTLLPSNEKQVIDGIFEVSVNDENKCTFFKQWRSVQNKTS